jgi:hypothetical protein
MTPSNPRNLPSAEKLGLLGIGIIDRDRLWLRCRRCDAAFFVQRLASGDLPAEYWQCPHGCNAAPQGDRTRAA